MGKKETEWAAIDMEIQYCALLHGLQLRPCTLHTAGALPLKSRSQLVYRGTKTGAAVARAVE